MRRLTLILAPVLAAGGLAACGGGSTAPGVALAPSGGATASSGSATTPTTPTTSSTPTTASTPTTVSTPKSGPLSTEPVVHVPTGAPPKALKTVDLIKGTGATATTGSTITVNYVGVLYKGGKQFDASWKRGQTFSTALSNGSVIPGWVKGISGMKVGGRRELIIPPSLAYGAAGSPPTIPPNSTLVFVVDLLSVGPAGGK